MNRKSPANSSQKPMKGQFPGAGRLRSAYPSLFEVLQITLAVFVLQAQAFADSPAPPRDYRTVTENQKYVFVMLALAGWSQQDSGIRKTYTQSGLYKNDGSTTPFWTVDWYANLVFPASDGEHLIRMGPWASSLRDLAVSFHKNGKEIRRYQIKDLVHDESKLMHTVSHFFWMSDLDYDDRNGILFLITKDKRVYRLSARTGEILFSAKTEEILR